AFGDIVHQAGNVKELRFFDDLENFIAEGMLGSMFFQRESSEIADDEERVLVDRVNMEEIVLHTANDAAEGWKVRRQNPVAVHPSQLMRDTAGLTQNFHKKPACFGISAEVLVDQVEMLTDQPDGRGAYA